MSDQGSNNFEVGLDLSKFQAELASLNNMVAQASKLIYESGAKSYAELASRLSKTDAYSALSKSAKLNVDAALKELDKLRRENDLTVSKMRKLATGELTPEAVGVTQSQASKIKKQ